MTNMLEPGNPNFSGDPMLFGLQVGDNVTITTTRSIDLSRGTAERGEIVNSHDGL